MQGVWTLVYYTWKKNLRLFMGHNSAGFHWIFHFHFPLKRVEYQPNYSFCELFILLRIVNLDGLTFLTALCSQMDVFSLVAGKGQRKFHFPRFDALPLSQRDSIMIEPITKFIHDASTLVTRRKTSFSISSPSSKLTISLILFTNMTLLTSLILAVRGTRVIHEFGNGPRSP